MLWAAVFPKVELIPNTNDEIIFKDVSSDKYRYTTINQISGGNVYKVGTPVDNQIGVWTGDNTIEGNANLTLDDNTFNLIGNSFISGRSNITAFDDNYATYFNPKIIEPDEIGAWTSSLMAQTACTPVAYHYEGTYNRIYFVLYDYKYYGYS